MKTVFLRVLESEDKATALLAAIAEHDVTRSRQRFEVDVASFSAVPRSPFAYWVSERLLNLFVTVPNMTARGGQTKCGLGTLDDFRFLRLAWEASVSASWKPFPKGGAFSPWYSDVPLVLSWEDDGTELKVFVEAKVGSASRKVQAQEFYFRPGLTWPRRTNGLSLRAMPEIGRASCRERVYACV